MTKDKKIETVTFPNGSSYEGEWKNGDFHGQGTFRFDGSIFTGEWKNGKFDGIGKVVYSSGATYDGKWKNNKQDGVGKMVYVDGSTYEGEWKNGKQDGAGKMVYDNGSKYNGKWKNGERHGLGNYQHSSGVTYNGEWKSNKRHGKGSIFSRIAQGGYDGEWENDEKHGQGTYAYSGGTKYDGKWENGFPSPTKPLTAKQKNGYVVTDINFLEDARDEQLIQKNYSSVTIKKIDPKSNLNLNIRDHACKRAGEENLQVVLFINSHGGKDGAIDNAEEILKILKEFKIKIASYNQQKAEGEKEISRVKLNIGACFGDECVTNSLLPAIQEFVKSGIEVRTSAAYRATQSALVGNGKNYHSSTDDATTIAERLFVPESKEVATVGLKPDKYQGSSVMKIGGITCYFGLKYFPTLEALLHDNYEKPSNEKPADEKPAESVAKPMPSEPTRGQPKSKACNIL